MAVRVEVVAESGILGGEARGVAVDPKRFEANINRVLAKYPSARVLNIQVASHAAPVSSESAPHLGTVMAIYAVIVYELDEAVTASFDAEKGAAPEKKPSVKKQSEPKTTCRACGAAVLAATAQATGGYCRSRSCEEKRCHEVVAASLDAEKSTDSESKDKSR